MIYILTFLLALLAVWLGYRIGVADGRREQPVVVRNDYNVNIDIAVVKAVIERYGWIVLEPQPDKTPGEVKH